MELSVYRLRIDLGGSGILGADCCKIISVFSFKKRDNVWLLMAGDIWVYLLIKGTKLQGASKDISKIS